MLFAELTYTLATEEAERIGVDHVARMTATGTGENSTGKLSVFASHWETDNILSYIHKNKNLGHNLITGPFLIYFYCIYFIIIIIFTVYIHIYIFFKVLSSLKSSIVCTLCCSC